MADIARDLASAVPRFTWSVPAGLHPRQTQRMHDLRARARAARALVIKQIAKKAKAPLDTSRDYEFTDWNAVDKLVDEVLSFRESCSVI